MSLVKLKKYKLGRRLGAGVFEKCQTQKFMLSQSRGKTKKRPSRPTDYGLQLIEKQKIRYTYGLRERQFVNYVNKAIENASAKATPAQLLFQALEKRLDNVAYRAGFASTRSLARQMVSHGHLVVNKVKTTIPSYSVQEGDVITIREGSKASKLFADLDKKLKSFKTPDWLTVDGSALIIKAKGVPQNPDPFLNFQSIIEFYSR